jgi:type I restriction enzyme S subunit
MNKSLEDLAVITYGKDYKSNPKGDIFPIFGTGGLMGYTSNKLNSGPAILTGRKGSINKPFYIEGDFWHVDTIFCVKAKTGVDIKWLFYNLKNIDLTKLNEATGVPSVNTQSLYRLTFKSFPLPQQRKIAQILSTCDAVIDKTEAAIAKYQAMKQGLMHDLFTRGIDVATGKLRPRYEEAKHLYKESELGWIPKEWDCVEFGKISVVNQGLQIAISERYKESGDNRYLYITIQYLNDIHNEGNTFYIQNPSESVICGKEDVLMVRTGNTGMIVTDTDGVFHNNFFKINYAKDVLKKYLVYYLNRFEIQTMIMNYAGTTTIPDLKHGEFYKIPFLKPTEKEQELIYSSLESLDKKIQTEQSALSKYQQLKTGLMQDLLSDKVEVRV